MELSVTEITKYEVVKISGKVDWESARKLDKKIKSLIDSGFVNIVFNLEDVSFICSGGIGALVYNLNRIRELGGAIYIISSNDYVNFIFDTLKFDTIFDGYLFNSFDEFMDKIENEKQEEGSR